MIVEFMGLSGSGKSTHIPILTRLLRDDGLVAMSVTEAIHHYMRKTHLGRFICALIPQAMQGSVLWCVFYYCLSQFYVAQFIIAHLKLVDRVVRLQFHRPIPLRHKWLLLRLFLEMAGRYQFLRSRPQPDEVLVFDEGFVHRSTHLFVSAAEQLDPDQIRAYLRLIPQADLIIRIQAPFNVCLTRIHARGLQTRLRKLSEQDINRFMANAEQVTNIVSQYLKNTGWHVIEVENQGDLSTSTVELHHAIRSYLSPAAGEVN